MHQITLNSLVITVIKTTLINGKDVKFDLMLVKCSVIFVNENENGEKRENNEFVNEN